jgi:3-carboxy-cis,cis-muconate cycloisomerase
LGEAGPEVALLLASRLGLKAPAMAWHTQRDEWVRLGMEVAILTGSLGKLAADLALMAQGEVGDLAEPSGDGRGGSSAMPHKRNPVSSMIGLAAATRAPQQAATLLAAMGQQHERGLGNWQAELADWPALFLSAHGALRALDEAIAGLQVDTARMRANIEALNGLVFAEVLSIRIAGAIGRPRAHEEVERMTRTVVSEGRHLRDVARDSIAAFPDLCAGLDAAGLEALFDPVAATAPAQALARRQLDKLRGALGALDATPAFKE